jgi:hypothetical protein
MKPEIKAKWVEALRSGKYEQGKNTLRSGNDRFCCLGVLCDVLQVPNTMVVGMDDEENYLYEGSDACLPERIRKMVGIWHRDQSKLIDLNDTENASFLEIADWIEKNL